MAFRAQLDDFAAYYERSYPVAYRTALGICADPGVAAEVTQDAFEAAYRARAGFRGEVPADAWLLRIVVNRAISAVRRRGGVRWVEPYDPTHHEPAVTVAPDAADALALRQALEALTPQQRAAVILRYYHDLDYAAIARAMETSVSNVGALLSRALDRLRPELEEPPGLAVTEPRHGQ